MLPYNEMLYHSNGHTAIMHTYQTAHQFWQESIGICFPIQLLWEQWESSLLKQDAPSTEDLLPYAQITTHWLLQHWILTKWHCRTHKLISISSRTSMWQAHSKIIDKITEHAAILHPKEQTNLLRQTHYTGLARITFIQNYSTHIEGKKATCNSINLLGSNYLITLSNCRFYVHNLKFHCKATDHNS